MRQRCGFRLGLGGQHRLGQPVRVFHPGFAAPTLQRHVVCPGRVPGLGACIGNDVIRRAGVGSNVGSSRGQALRSLSDVNSGDRDIRTGRIFDTRRNFDLWGGIRCGRLSRHGRGVRRCFARLPDVAGMDVDIGIGSGSLGGPCFSLWHGLRICTGNVCDVWRAGQGPGTRQPQRPQAQCGPCAAPTCSQHGIVLRGGIVRHRDRIFRHFVGSRGQRITQASSWRPSAAR